ncbi:MAG: CDP-diacylglycerol--glycerol-3-phosphate 3-phosphatidyltransferase [Caldicoprobacterales bacterium]|jgi:cardiolipin synthase|nr:CDP-diacylglycerol--glycerol-3-phosphate 3-phosphatidyltransferase [Clostridiales bacterium]
MNVPNALTLVRFMLIGFYPWLYFNEGLAYHKVWAFAVFLVAGLTDVLDGFIARRYNLITKWGKLMDPLADKLMLITVLLCLFIDEVIPIWVILIIALKELLMILGAAFLYRNRKMVVQANFYGKLATFLFYIAVTALVFELNYARYILFVAVFSTILALLQYAVRNFMRFAQPENKGTGKND